MNGETSSSYYGRSVVKPHVWTHYVPWYFWIGGVTGVSSVHCALARARGNDALADVQKRVALAGLLVSPVLLILDLGVPLRFLNMLRVFKITSPMSVGSWILSGLAGCVVTSNIADWLGMRRIGRTLEIPAAFLGPCLTTYTAALVANTATPIWHEASDILPFVFASSGICGSGACAVAFLPPERATSAHRMMVGGAFAMTVLATRMETQLGPLLSEPYRKGAGGAYRYSSAALALSGVLLGIVGRKSTTATRVAALLIAAAGVCERFSIMAAGKQSALDPKYTVELQRERLSSPKT